MQLLDHLDRIQDRLARNAAFMLHQATERFYRCILLVLTRYSLKPPRSNRLRSPAESLDARLIMAWPQDTKFARRCFARPNRACVEAPTHRTMRLPVKSLLGWSKESTT